MDGTSSRTTLAQPMAKRLLRCRACRLAWFPQGPTAPACPACGGKEIGGALEFFHVGLTLIASALIAWVWPLFGAPLPGLRHEVAAAGIASASSDPGRAPPQAQPLTTRRAEKTAIAKHDVHRVPAKNRTMVSAKKIKRKNKSKKRSQHVQR